jgi:pimeloyl-ACP methyl ester carboxylesterase
MKPLIHFAHANGVPAAVYQKIFAALADDFDVIAVPCLGADSRYPIDNHWRSLTQQVIDYIVQHAQGRPVIGIGHSLGGVLSFQAAVQRPELFSKVIMLDPPLIMGQDCLALHVVKTLGLVNTLDNMSPAGLSKKRRDHWESREQAAELLRPKGFYADFDRDCFQDYISHALMPDALRGGVELRIAKQAEVEIFRTNPSKWWLPQPKLQVPMHLIAASKGPFLSRQYPQKIKRKFGVPYSVWEGGHMFPLEQPLALAVDLKQLIASL